MLPPAEQLTPLFAGSNGGNGIFSYPNLGTVVAVGFWNQDQNMPFFFGATLGGQRAFGEYDDVRRDVTEDNIRSGEDAFVHKVSANLTTVRLWESGYAEVFVRKDAAGSDNCKVTLDGKGNVIVSSTQQIQVNAPNIVVSASDAMQLKANTIKITAGSELDVITPQEVHMNGLSFNVQSPSINLDATSGCAAIKGKRHTAFYN